MKAWSNIFPCWIQIRWVIPIVTKSSSASTTLLFFVPILLNISFPPSSLVISVFESKKKTQHSESPRYIKENLLISTFFQQKIKIYQTCVLEEEKNSQNLQYIFLCSLSIYFCLVSIKFIYEVVFPFWNPYLDWNLLMCTLNFMIWNSF